ncbi:hypothetical protein ONS95_007026 [Cadophora gregata]|uniref:uncharacterized protein n=1 Tax=Cadophora gregata TaxID=51156 RepID=UPI0026DC0BE4|nr:uncharacterized protein ONS95_007026 [Cadophora gregata]KAK0100568.1 hypothetical protein ONS95_007026 [Cadophora gregata]
MSSNILVTGAAAYVCGSNVADFLSSNDPVLKESLNVVIHTASSLDLNLGLNLLAGLAEQQKRSGSQAYFIHPSGLSAFCPKTGWPEAVMQGSGPIFDTEKQFADSFAIRNVDVTIFETAKSLGITSFIVVPSTVCIMEKKQES